VKKGENLLVTGKQGEWSSVQTDSGKKGWVLSTVVSAGGLAGLDTSSTTVAAAEGDTALAMRGRPFVPRTLVLGMGALKGDSTKKLGELLKASSKLKVLEVRDEAMTKPGSAAGGVDGATQLMGTQTADLVVAIQSAGTGDALMYEVVDLKNKKVLGAGTTTSAKPVDEVVEAVAVATKELTKNPADAAAVPAVPAATPALAVTPVPAASPAVETKSKAPGLKYKK